MKKTLWISLTLVPALCDTSLLEERFFFCVLHIESNGQQLQERQLWTVCIVPPLREVLFDLLKQAREAAGGAVSLGNQRWPHAS